VSYSLLRLPIAYFCSQLLVMYRRPRFLEELHAIREEMSRECDYDVDLFAEMVRSNRRPAHGPARNIRGVRQHAPPSTSFVKTKPRRQARKKK
jgi:hypothetical protein